MRSKWLFILALAAVITFGQPRVTYADAIMDIHVNTSLLHDPIYRLFFQVIDGDSIPGNTSVTLDRFDFAGGGVPVPGGTRSGLDPLTLTDTDFFSFFEQDFVPGAGVSFRLNASAPVDPSETPDGFAFSILYQDSLNGWSPIPTGDIDGGSLVTVFFNSSTPTILNFGTVDNPVDISPVEATPVPEPGTLLLLSLGLTAAAGRRFRRQSRRLFL